MAYVAADDFREETRKPWTRGLTLTEGDANEAELDLVIAQVAGLVELELDDDFDPPNPDVDETIVLEGTIGSRLWVPRRVRSLTSVGTRSLAGVVTALAATAYRLHSSLNGAGTAMLDGYRKRDWLDSLSSTTWADDGVQLVGKFGWAAPPNDVRRLVALRVYDMVKPTGDPLSTVAQRVTSDGSLVLGESREMARIVAAYGRRMAVTA
jgi:hypothetical protein